MLVERKEAVRVYESLPADLRVPGLHPLYIAADATRHRDRRPEFHVFTDGGAVFYHGYLTGPVPGTAFRDIETAYGYGGPVATSTDRDFLRAAWAEYGGICADTGVLAEFMRFHPMVDNARFHGAVASFNRQTVWVDLLRPNVSDGFKSRARTAARKAEKAGVTIEWVDGPRFLETFPAMYDTHMKWIGASPAYFFPRAYHEALAALPDARLALAFLDGAAIAGSIFLIDGHLMEYHLSASNREGRDRSATNLILLAAAGLGWAEGCRVLHLGGGNSDAPDDPLFFFKCGFSSGRADYRIAGTVHHREAYDALSRAWLAENGSLPQRTLFFR